MRVTAGAPGPARRGPPTQHCSALHARVLLTRTLSATDSLSISLVIQYISSRIHTYIPTAQPPGLVCTEPETRRAIQVEFPTADQGFPSIRGTLLTFMAFK